MKKIHLLATSLFISVAAMAQNNPSTVDISAALNNQPQPQLIATTSLGKVYAMPTDNMPCLVPFTATEGSMPVLKTPLYQNEMPSAIPLQQLQLLPNINNRLKLHVQPATDNKNLMFELLGKKKPLKNPL
ncbi:MAG: hypothetical protein WDM90_16210 [Ferruginibacter sp.]